MDSRASWPRKPTPRTRRPLDLWQKIRPTDRDIRRRGLHRAQGQPGRVRGASPGGLRRWSSSMLVRAAAVSPPDAERRSAPVFALEIPRPAFDGPVPAEKESHWSEAGARAESATRRSRGMACCGNPYFLRFGTTEAGGMRDTGCGKRDPGSGCSSIRHASRSRLPPPEVQFHEPSKGPSAPKSGIPRAT